MHQEPESVHPDYRARKDTRVSFSLIVLFAVLCVSIFLFGRELILSMKSGDVIRGLSAAPWVGFANYQHLFSSPYLVRLVRNTFLFNLLFAGMSFVIVSLLGSLLEVLPKVLKEIVAVFFGLLLFLPVEVFAGWIIHLTGSIPLTSPVIMRYLHPFLCTVKYMGIPLMLIALRNEIYAEKDGLASVKIAGLYSLASLIFLSSGFFTMTKAFYNPLTYETMDMLDTYSYRSGLLEMNGGISAAAGIFQTLIALVSAAVLFVPILALFRSAFRGERKDRNGENIVGRLVPSLIAFVLFAAIYFLPYINKGYSFDMGQFGQRVDFAGPVFSFVLVSSVSALIATALAAATSGTFANTGCGLRIMAGIVLTLITVLCASPVRVSNYLLIKDMGFLNTYFGIIVSTCFSAAAVWAMICMRRGEPTPAGKSFFQSVLALFLIQTALVYGNIIPQLFYLTQPNATPLMTFRQLITGMQSIGDVASRKSLGGVIGLYGFLASLPPMLLFLAVNIFLPEDKLMAVISAGVKN